MISEAQETALDMEEMRMLDGCVKYKLGTMLNQISRGGRETGRNGQDGTGNEVKVVDTRNENG